MSDSSRWRMSKAVAGVGARSRTLSAPVPSSTSHAARRASTCVLPVPGPPRISSGPPRCVTAASCARSRPSSEAGIHAQDRPVRAASMWAHCHSMARLKRADCTGPGLARRKRGKGFEYLDEDGRRISEPEVLERIGELRIPPAWQDVWICPWPMGHIQATGVDAAGRKQYLYHQRWRELQDKKKFDSMVRFAKALPDMREQVERDLAGDGITRQRVLVTAECL